MLKNEYDAENKIWRGPKLPPLYNPDQGIGSLILRILEQTPEAVNQISADTYASVTCKQLYDRSIRFAKYLQKCAIKTDDKIGFLTSNSENLPPVVFACFVLGFPINPLSPIMNELDIVQMYSKTQPKMIFCDAENLKVVQNAVNEMKSDAKILTVMEKVDGYDCVSDILKEMEMENVDDFECPLLDPNSTAAILCSSGSTGFPKGICKSHKQIITDLFQFCPKTSQASVMFQGSAIFWVSGFLMLIGSVAFRFTRVCTTKKLNVQLILDMIEQHKINAIFLPPFMLVAFLQFQNLEPLKRIQFLFVGGSVVSDQLCQKLKPFLPNGQIIPVYGCTEEDLVAVNYTNKNFGSSGFPLNNVEIKIIDDNGSCLGPNEKGEIYTKIPKHFTCYFEMSEETAETFDDDWFKTGDIGYFDSDGYLYVVERKKEMLKYESYQVTPSEIEAIIDGIKGVRSSYIIGVLEPQTGNDIIHAFVIVEESCNITEDFIMEYVNERVIDSKRIRGGVYFIKTVPLGLTGKVDRKKLREMIQKFDEIRVTKF